MSTQDQDSGVTSVDHSNVAFQYDGTSRAAAPPNWSPPVPMQSLSPKRSNHSIDVNRSRSFNEGSMKFWGKEQTNHASEEPEVLVDEAGDQFVWEFHTIPLTRVPGFGFGIAVSGGTDNPHFASGDPSVAISDVLRAGPAEGKLLINDRILSANGVSLENVDNATAIRVLMESGDTVSLFIKRKVLLVGEVDQMTRKITLSKAKKKDEYGIVLGYRLYVKEIIGDSIAANEGTVKEGDTVLKINGQAAENVSLVEAQKLIEKGKDKLNLVVSRSVPRRQTSLTGGSLQEVYLLPRPASAHDVESKKPSNIEGLLRLPSRNRNPVYEASLTHLDDPVPVPQLTPSPGSGEEQPRSPPVPPPPPAPAQAHIDGDRQLHFQPFPVIPMNGQLPVPIYEGYYSNVAHRMQPDPRFISFRKEGSVGIRLTGGNEVGIFVAAVQPRSPAALAGLRPGDRILKVNERPMESVTREEAVLFLLSLHDKINMIVQFRRDEYERVVAIQLGDSFYIRTHFNYEQTEKGELSFRTGDIFHIKDTLHNGVVGSWEAARVGRNNEETQVGIIPNQSRADQLALAAITGSSTKTIGRSTFFKRRKSARRSKSLNRDHWDEIVFAESGSRFPAYEKIKWKYPGFVRPIVVFGALGDAVRERLLADMPDRFESPQTEVGEGDKLNKSGIVRLGAIREIIEKDKHAVIDVTPSAVDSLNYAQYYPIVIFLRAENKNQVKSLRIKNSKSAGRSSRKLFETGLKLEKMYSYLFTATVTLTNNDLYYKKVLDTIDKQQQQPVWMSDVKLECNLDDEFLFPMTTRLSYASRDAESDLDIGSDTEGGGLRPISLFSDSIRPSRPIVRASSVTETDQGYNVLSDQEKSRYYEGDRREGRLHSHGLPGPGEERYYPSFYAEKRDVQNIEPYATITPRQRHVRATYAAPPLAPNVDRAAKPPRQFEDSNPESANRFSSESENYNGTQRQHIEPPEKDDINGQDLFARHIQQSVSEKFGSPMTASSREMTSRERLTSDGPPHDPYKFTRSTATPSKPVHIDRSVLSEISSKFRQSDREKRDHSIQVQPTRDAQHQRKTSEGETDSRSKHQKDGTDTTYAPAVISPARSTSASSKDDVPKYPEPPKYHSPSYYRQAYAKEGGDPRPGSAEYRSSRELFKDGTSPARYRPAAKFSRSRENMQDSGPIRENIIVQSDSMTQSYPGPVEMYNHSFAASSKENIFKDAVLVTPTTNNTLNPPTSTASSQPSAVATTESSRVKHGSQNEMYKTTAPTKDIAPTRDKEAVPSKHAKPPRESPISGPNLSSTSGEPRRSAFAPYTKVNGVKDSVRPAPPPKPPKPNVSSPPSTTVNKPLPLTEPPISENHRVVATARGTFDHNGGELVSEETGVSIVIPKGAIPEGVKQEIYFKVCQDSSILPPLDAEKGETLLSPLVMCGPHGLKFQQPVELRLPHSASVNPESWSFALKSSETPTGQPTEWQNVQLAGVDGVSQPGRVGANSVSVLVDHF